MKPPPTVNMMAPTHTGPPGLLGLPTSTLFDPPPSPPKSKVMGWLSEANNKVVPVESQSENEISVPTLHPTTGAEAPLELPGEGGALGPPKMSAAAALLLKKSAQEKRATYNTIAAASKAHHTDGGEGEDDAATRDIPHKEVDSAIEHAQQLLRNQAERERIRTTATRIRVSIKAVKHLPKMDKFGKTDAYCVTALDNKRHGGQRYKRTTKVVKRNLNPEWSQEIYDFEVKNFLEQDLFVTCWDWDAGSEDQVIGHATVHLTALLTEKVVEQSYQLMDEHGNTITGHDGSPTIVRIQVERDVAALDAGFNINSMVGDAEEVRVLDCTNPPWETAVRGLMFDIENHSKYPVLITGLQAQSGRGNMGSCAYTVYRAPGRWNNGRCPCHRTAPFKFMCCCCGRCPSGKERFGMMKWCCRCTPCGSGRIGCCCCGECGPGLELAEPCCEGCIPCCTGKCAAHPVLVPLAFPFFCCFCGYCTGPANGGVGAPGLPGVPLCRCCGCLCCRNGVHRHTTDCTCGPCLALNCSWASCCCYCCRKKFMDRRRWTRVASQWAELPSDWGALGPLASFEDFEGGGVLIPAKQTHALFVHSPNPEGGGSEHALAIRGPFTRGFKQGDVTAKDPFIKLHTGPCTQSRIPFPNSDPLDSSRDGQFYDLHQQHLEQYKVCAFSGTVLYRVLEPAAVPSDCLTLCGSCPHCC